MSAGSRSWLIVCFVLVFGASTFMVEVAQGQAADKKGEITEKVDGEVAKASEDAKVKAKKESQKTLDNVKSIRKAEDAGRKVRRIKTR